MQPFQQKFPVNPSWEIAKGLPSRLQPLRAKDAADNTNGGGQTIDLPAVRILVHPEPLPVKYKPVRDLVPSLWDDTHQGRRVDAVIHIGMAGPRTSYLVERRAHRRGYRNVDVDCKLPEEGMDGRPNDPDWIWYDQPDEIVSDLDIDDVHARWQACSSVRRHISLPSPQFCCRTTRCPYIYLHVLLKKQYNIRPLLTIQFIHYPNSRKTWTCASPKMLATFSATGSTIAVCRIYCGRSGPKRPAFFMSLAIRQTSRFSRVVKSPLI